MGSSEKAQELRALLGLAVKLRSFADTCEDLGDLDLFLAAALALEGRAKRLAFGEPVAAPPQKIDLVC